MGEMKGLASFTLSFWSGLQGGAIGGAVAAIPIVIGYYLQEPFPAGDAAVLVLFVVLVGVTTGVSAQLGMALFRHLRDDKRAWASLLNDFTGASLACAIGGTLIGILGGWLYGQVDREPIGGPLVVASALLGSSVVLYDTGGRFVRMIRYCLYPLPLSIVVAIAAYWVLQVDLYAKDMAESLGRRPAGLGARPRHGRADRARPLSLSAQHVVVALRERARAWDSARG